MQEDNFTLIEKDLQQIADMLLLNGTLTECPGLVHGKMGIAVFFFHYALHTGEELFADYAMDLIDEMLNQIHVNSLANYERGIAGIGVGIDYLIRNSFLNVEDDICEDLDQRIVRAVLYDPCEDFSQYNGLTGYGYYWITRLRYEASLIKAKDCLLRIIVLIEEKLPDIPEKEKTDVYCFLHKLCQIKGFEMFKSLLNQFKKQTLSDFHRLGNSTVGNLVRMYLQSMYFNCKRKDDIKEALMQVLALDMEKPPESTGLLTGYAGEGMLRLTAIEPSNISWINLL